MCYTFYGENMNKIVGRVLVLIYLSFVVILSLYLFMYSRFGTSSVGRYVIFNANNISSVKGGSLVLIKNDVSSIEVGESIFLYNVYSTKKGVLENKVTYKEKLNEEETTYGLDNNKSVSSSYVLGEVNKAKIIPILGYVFNFLSSPLGYLFFALVPTLLMFVFQVHTIFKKYDF